MIGIEENSAEVGEDTDASIDFQGPVVKATRPQGRLLHV